MSRVCIVTPDIIGPMKNGGIGTHCYWLLKKLTEAGHDVTVVYTGIIENGSLNHWKKRYGAEGVVFVATTEWPDLNWPQVCGYWFVTRSQKILKFLEEGHFDFVHFQDWHANGFAPIQAKRTGVALKNTTLTVSMHSSSQWIREGMLKWSDSFLDDMLLDHCERYCCKHADMLISPSKYMFDWALDKGWRLAENRRVVPNCYDFDSPKPPPGPPDLTHLIFFGRLETRKGLDVFIESLSRVLQKGLRRFNRISFIGKYGDVGRGNSEDSIRAFKKRYPGVKVTVNIRFDAFAALKYIQESNGVVVIPSLVDNYPYTVVECIQNSVPFLAARTGGIPEMVATPNRLFEPTVKGLTETLENIEEIFKTGAEYGYNPQQARDGWLNVHEWRPSPGMEKHGEAQPTPLVSICVPYYNLGRYLPDLLGSIEKSSYTNYEVIVINDGSTDGASIKVFEDMKTRYGLMGWKFNSKPNGGIGHTRNHAASLASGEFIIFMDADNLATPGMIKTYVNSVRQTGADCLACHYHAFPGDNLPLDENTAPAFSYLPIGACVEAGVFQNIFGDANFIIKKSVFDEIGGFREDRDTSWEDYEFLALLVLRGYKFDVIPKPLFWYRHLETGFSQVTNKYKNHQRALRPYIEESPENLRFLWGHIVSLNNLFTDGNNNKFRPNPFNPLDVARWFKRSFMRHGLLKGTKHIMVRTVAGLTKTKR